MELREKIRENEESLKMSRIRCEEKCNSKESIESEKE